MRQTPLFAEPSAARRAQRAVNVASVPHRSPFRYPGGKTWFVPRLREWLRSRCAAPGLLIEPFAGGGIISLTAVFEGLVERALMVELDDEIAAVWKVVVNGECEWQAGKILRFAMSKANEAAALGRDSADCRDTAFKTIIKNRTFHGGILAPGAGFIKNGESGKGVLSRWYPSTLARRLRDIHRIHHRLEFRHADAFTVMEQYAHQADAVFFIDPPYTAGFKSAGKRLYTHYALDHDALFCKCAMLKGDFIMTYDNAPEVIALAGKHRLQARAGAMRNTHHAVMTELVIGRNLDWMDEAEPVLATGHAG